MLQALPDPIPAINQLELQPWHAPHSLISYCQSHGILLIAFCPLARASPDRLADPVITKICKRTNKTWGQVLLRWSLQRGFIPIPRTANPARVKENADLFEEGFVLTQREMEAMDALSGPEGIGEKGKGEGCSAPNAWKLMKLP